MAIKKSNKQFRGFVLTLDSVIALGFAISFMAFIVSASKTNQNTYDYAVSVQSFSDDFSNLLSQTGLLNQISAESDSQVQLQLQSLLNQTLPKYYSASVKVSTYSYQPSSTFCPSSCPLSSGLRPQNNFCLCRQFTQFYSNNGTTSSFNASNIGSSYGIFFSNINSTPIYGIAQTMVWVN